MYVTGFYCVCQFVNKRCSFVIVLVGFVLIWSIFTKQRLTGENSWNSWVGVKHFSSFLTQTLSIFFPNEPPLVFNKHMSLELTAHWCALKRRRRRASSGFPFVLFLWADDTPVINTINTASRRIQTGSRWIWGWMEILNAALIYSNVIETCKGNKCEMFSLNCIIFK